ncbi:MAG: ABC transporter ATP-binding protein [Verrucomicrobiota bacterium]
MNSVIRMENLCKDYASGETIVRAVRGISFEIFQGEFVAIMGASGSGKSTLMNILGCLDRASSGNYFLNNENVSKLSAEVLVNIRNQKIGFVFQSFNLLARTSSLENVELPLLYSHRRYGSREMKERAQRALETVGLADRAHHYPNQLSGGQQQRVAIARALVNDPELILADEPTGNLDSQVSVEIMSVFQQLNDQGRTVVMITHESDIASFAKRNIHLRDGKIIEDALVKNRLIQKNLRS